MNKALKSRKSGFTLIELLVVVLIVGILAAVAIPQYFGTLEKGYFSEAMGCIDAIKGGEERYIINVGNYTNATDLTAAPGSANNPLDISCKSIRYFNGAVPAITGAGAAGYKITMTRGGSGFNTISGLTANYTITFTRNNAGADTWAGTGGVPNSWLPQ